MINTRLFDDCIAYARQQPAVENGEIAAVLIDNAAAYTPAYRYQWKYLLSQ